MATVIKKITGQIIYGTISENVQLLPDEILIDKNPTEVLLNGYYNFETQVFFENASNKEIDNNYKANVPLEVPLWAMRNILKKRNLLNDIIEAVQKLPEPLKTDALDFLEYGNFIERESNTVILIQQITQKSNKEVDDLFIEANNIRL